MATVSRIKQRLVRDLVRDNLDLADGKAQVRRVKRAQPSRKLAWLILAVLAVPLGVLVSGWVVYGDGLAIPRWLGAAPQVAQAAPPAIEAAGDLESAAQVAAEARIQKELIAELERLRALEASQAVAPEIVELAASADSMVQQVLPLAVRRVVIDPGHGGKATGTRDPHGVIEKDVVLDVALRLRALLEASGFEVLMTRESDVDVSLQERARIANSSRGDLFVSIHVNWIENRQARGVETYYLGASDDPYVNQLAAEENRDSGYSLADLRHLLDRIYSGVRISKSQRLAQEMQSALFHSLVEINPALTDRGVKRAPFVVLVDTQMPAVLAEVSCLSNERESRLLLKPLYRQFIAEALAKGVRGYSAYSDPEARPPDPVEQKGS